MAQFDSKSFNEKAFKYSVEHPRIPNLKTNELKKSKALKGSKDIRDVFTSQNGTVYAEIAMKGLLDGQAVNYDGETDITATNTKTFNRGVVVVGRAKAWTEKDFSDDVSGEDFMENVADQVADYKDGLDQDTLLAILEGIYKMTGTKNLEFVNNHTLEIAGNVDETSLNTATNKACGANKKKFTMVFAHSDIATHLENLKLLQHLKYTDKDGIERPLDLAAWNGKLVIIDDDMPATVGYMDSAQGEDGALKIVANSATPSTGEIKLSNVTPYLDAKTLAAGDYVVLGTKYITYVLGDGAFDYEDIGAKVPYEMSRDPKTNGGQDTLYMRQRKVFAPFGISFTKSSMAKNSPTDAELKTGANWEIVHSGEAVAANRSYINHKAIPIARIISRG